MEEERRRKQNKFVRVTPEGFFRSLDQNGRTVFDKVYQFAAANRMPIHWWTKGFSLNVDLNGTHVAVCFCYPATSAPKQCIYTNRGLSAKTQVPDEEIVRLWSKAEATRLFRPAGKELKCSIDRPLTDMEVDQLLEWCQDVAATIVKYGLRE